MPFRPLVAQALSALLVASACGAALAENITLKASHQFPGGKGDVRDEMVQMIARDVAAANVGLEIKVFPGSSLVKAQEQWKAMLSGQIDMSSFPLDYASGLHPQFGATLMPGLVKSHAHARRINDSAFMKDIKAVIEQGGVKVLADAWLAGAFGGKEKCIVKPADAAGLKVRSAGATFAEMWAGAGASIVSIPSNEVYNALQQGVAQGGLQDLDARREWLARVIVLGHDQPALHRAGPERVDDPRGHGGGGLPRAQEHDPAGRSGPLPDGLTAERPAVQPADRDFESVLRDLACLDAARHKVIISLHFSIALGNSFRVPLACPTGKECHEPVRYDLAAGQHRGSYRLRRADRPSRRRRHP